MSKSFAAQVGKWASQSEKRITAVRNASIDALAAEMVKTKGQGGRLPFDTGNLALSILASKSGMPSVKDGKFSGGNVGAVTATLQPSETVWIGYQASYARRMNYGFVGADSLGRNYNQSGNYFLEHAIKQWPAIVAKTASKLQKESGG